MRKHMGMFDTDLLAAIDECAERATGGNRRLWVERALRAAMAPAPYEPTPAQREAMDGLARDGLQALCGHEVRQVRSDGRAVSCGMCGAELDVTAEDRRRLAAAGPEPVSVSYADAHDSRGTVDRHLSVPPPLRHGVGPKPVAASKPRPKAKKP